MKVCFPVGEDIGLRSLVFEHFGSAPTFLVVDVGTNVVTALTNSDRIHEHGACNPLAGLGGEKIDAIVVGGIGGGALFKLNAAGIRVFQAQRETVAQNLVLFQNNLLPEYMPGHTCGGHGNSGCGH